MECSYFKGDAVETEGGKLIEVKGGETFEEITIGSLDKDLFYGDIVNNSDEVRVESKESEEADLKSL